MQSINITVINPLFMGVLFGTGLLSAYFVFLGLRGGGSVSAVAGAVFYIAGVIGVTLAMNVPLNNELAALDAAAVGSVQVWSRYLSDWTFWNSVRGLAAAASCLAFATSLSCQ